MRINFKGFLAFFVLLAAAGLLVFRLETEIFRPVPELVVSFLDVGQGDAILVSYLGKHQVLIDGGPSVSLIKKRLGETMPLFDRKIEVLVLTHPDFDHGAGLVGAAEKYEIGVLLENGQEAETEFYQRLKGLSEERGFRREKIKEGSEIIIGDLKMKIFHPDEMTESQERNDQSVVIRLDFGENSFLFTGDAEGPAEAEMLSDGEEVDADFLKVGHHGSKSSTSDEFLRSVTPADVFISVGADNRYGHPTQEMLERLEKIGAKIWRTDQQGTIQVVCEDLKQPCQVR